MKKKAIFLDRDGTIIVDKHYMHSPEELELLDGAVAGLKKLERMGFLLIIITNQSGIGRGYFTEREYEIFQEALLLRLQKNGIKIAASYYCPHMDSDKCNCRKPNLGLFETAINDFQIELKQSYAVGDNLRDLAIFDESPSQGFLIGKNKGTKTEFRMVESLDVMAECIASDINRLEIVKDV